MPVENWIAARIPKEVAQRLAEIAGQVKGATDHINFAIEPPDTVRNQMRPDKPSKRQNRIRSGRQGRRQYNGTRSTKGAGRRSFVSAVYAGTDPDTGKPKGADVFQGPFGPLGTRARDTATDTHKYTNDPQSYGRSYGGQNQ